MDVLILDDDPHQVETIRRGLHHVGHPARGATPAEARDRLAHGPATAVVCDLTGPSPERARLLGELRATRPDVALVVLAGLRTTPEVAALEAEGVVVLRRPFGPLELAAALRHAAGR